MLDGDVTFYSKIDFKCMKYRTRFSDNRIDGFLQIGWWNLTSCPVLIIFKGTFLTTIHLSKLTSIVIYNEVELKYMLAVKKLFISVCVFMRLCVWSAMFFLCLTDVFSTGMFDYQLKLELWIVVWNVCANVTWPLWKSGLSGWRNLIKLLEKIAWKACVLWW